MRQRAWIPLAASLAALLPTLATAGATHAELPPLLDRSEEVALALSACPTAIAEHAAVYVLEKAGYVRVRDSQNVCPLPRTRTPTRLPTASSEEPTTK